MNCTDTVAAHHNRFNSGYEAAIEDAASLDAEEIAERIAKADRLGEANRERDITSAAHYYEGRALGFRTVLKERI